MQEWDEQKLVNARLVVGIVGLLVGGQGEGRKSNQVGNIALVMSSDAYLARAQVQFLQNAIWQSGLTKCLFELALASTAPPLLKAQALNVLASILKSSRSNQDLLSSLLVCPLIAVETAVAVNATLADGSNGADVPARPSTSTRPSADLSSMQTSERTYTRLPARPAILALIGTAVHGAGADGGLGMRAAALACFEAFVADNLDARLAIISTMVPPPTDNPNDERANERPMSAGSLLLEGLTDFPDAQTRFDPYKHLVAALLFVHLIRGSETAKRMARDIAIGPDGRTVMREPRAADTSGDDDDDDDRASLIQVVVGNLTMAEREQTEAARRDRAAGLAADAGSASGGKNTAMDWTRVMIGYLVCLSTWLWDSPLSVREFLAESANLQVVSVKELGGDPQNHTHTAPLSSRSSFNPWRNPPASTH